jgi:hypothetical protein
MQDGRVISRYSGFGCHVSLANFYRRAMNFILSREAVSGNKKRAGELGFGLPGNR